MDPLTIAATLDGEPAYGTVADGAITGSPALVEHVERMLRERVRVGEGPWAGTATLDGDVRMIRATLAAACDHGSARIDGPAAPVEPVPACAES